MIYLQLFLSFFQIGLFSFGGGYAAMPLIQGQIVKIHGWMTMSEFTDLITISQMTPGPIAVNSATFVGLRVAGYVGAVVATLGCILPSCIIVTVIVRLYLRFHLVPAILIMSIPDQTAVTNIETPADAIIATTAGLIPPSSS